MARAFPAASRMILLAAPMLLLPVVSRSLAEDRAVPVAFAQLVERGRVEIEFYDPRRVPRPFPGMTDFRLQVRHRYRYTTAVQGRGRDRVVEIKITFASIESEFRHKILLPQRYDHDELWSEQLVRHEFDHVAVSADPRIDLLVDHLYQNLSPLRLPLPRGPVPGDGALQRYINAEIARRRKGVLDLIESNYQLLDKVSRHGREEIPEREAFFESLYSKANLDRHGFPFTGDLLPLLRTEAYQQTELLYLPGQQE